MTDKLKELQYAAQECKDIRGLPPSWYDFDTLAITYGIGHTDAMLIAAASPDAILALIKRAEDVEAGVELLKQQYSTLRIEYGMLESQLTEDENVERERDALQAEVERLNGNFTQITIAFQNERSERERLQARVNAMESQEPVAQYAHYPDQHRVGPNDGGMRVLEALAEIPIGAKLYLAPGAAPKPLTLPKNETDAMHDAVMAVVYHGVTRTNTNSLWRAYRSALIAAQKETDRG